MVCLAHFTVHYKYSALQVLFLGRLAIRLASKDFLDLEIVCDYTIVSMHGPEMLSHSLATAWCAYHTSYHRVPVTPKSVCSYH